MTTAAALELARRYGERAHATRMGFRAFAESPLFCGVTFSPLMAAIADAADGRRASTIDDATAMRHFGCELASLPLEARRTVAVRAGGRAGKSSRLVGCKTLHAAWTVPLPTLARGEAGTALLVAPTLKLARQTLSFVRGYVEGSACLRPALVTEPTTDSITLRRPDGKLVRVEVLAASRRGTAVRARTLVGAFLDEACFFYDDTTGVVNDGDIYRAVAQRVVPGGQVWIVSTPWLAGVGLLEQRIKDDWGRHEGTLCCTAGTRALNPAWDPDGVIEADLRAQDPDAARREIDGEPLAGTAAGFFDPVSIDAAVDPALTVPRKPLVGETVTAGGDFAFRSDAAAVAVVHRAGKVRRVGGLLELRPDGAPLVPSAVVREFAAHLKTHAGLEYLVADGHYRETVTEHLAEFDLGFVPAPQDVASTYLRARALLREGHVRLPAHPRLLAQLKAVQWRANQGGTISVILPREKAGGHCDLVSALVLALWESGGVDVVDPDAKPKAWRPAAPKTAAEVQAEADALEAAACEPEETDGFRWG